MPTPLPVLQDTAVDMTLANLAHSFLPRSLTSIELDLYTTDFERQLAAPDTLFGVCSDGKRELSARRNMNLNRYLLFSL